MPEKAISVAEACRMLRVGLPYIYALIWSGKLAAQKIDGRWQVSEEAVHARMKGRED